MFSLLLSPSFFVVVVVVCLFVVVVCLFVVVVVVVTVVVVVVFCFVVVVGPILVHNSSQRLPCTPKNSPQCRSVLFFDEQCFMCLLDGFVRWWVVSDSFIY